MRFNKNKNVIILLAIGHGLNDLIAGYFLGSLVLMRFEMIQIGLGLFIYNLLAFGGQYPIALWLEKFSNAKMFLISSYILNIVAVAVFIWAPHLSIVLAGIASAIYHVSGGSFCARDNKAFNIGLFAAPGVLGLIAGGYFAFLQTEITGWLLAASIVFLIILALTDVEEKTVLIKNTPAAPSNFRLERHDLVMILLLTIISLRSVIWNIFQLLHDKNYSWLLAIALSAFAGKIVGGWLADKIGWRLYVFISLITATPLIIFFKDELILFCIGIGLLQSGIPATTSLLILSVRGKTERAIGLSFGTAIIAGAIVLYTPLRDFLFYKSGLLAITAVMLLLLFFCARRKITTYSIDKSI